VDTPVDHHRPDRLETRPEPALTSHDIINAAMRQPDPWTCSICGHHYNVASLAYSCCLNTPNDPTEPATRTGVSPDTHPPTAPS
jgi:hypothetical protein